MNPGTIVAAALALAFPAADETVTTGGHQVSYRVTGDPAAGTPMLVLHGGMMNAETTFGPMMVRLAADRAVIGVDQQGHGGPHVHTGPTGLRGDPQRGEAGLVEGTDLLGVVVIADTPCRHVV